MCAKMVSMTLEYPEPELLDELRLEFGDKGQRAIEFLTTAHMFLQFDEDLIPRLGPAVAYCLREAMTSVLGSVVIAEEDTLNDVADRVIKARDNYRQAANLPGGDAERAFGDLLERISDLEDVRGRERWNQRRLIAVMVDRTGAEPLSSGTRPVRAYQSLLVRLNDALHGSRPDVGAAQLWSVCIAIFRQLFIPPQTRFSELESFARIASPTAEDVDAVHRRLVSPQHLRYFMKKVTSPVWLSALKPTGHLDPPDAGAAWQGLAGVVRLAEEHHEEVTSWLEEMHELHRAKPKPAADIARAALDIGGPALLLVLRAVQDHPQSSGIVMLADMAVQHLDASDELVQSFAGVLLQEDSFSLLGYAKPLMGHLAGGVNESNALGRLQLLCDQMRNASDDSYSLRSLLWDSSGSVTDHDEFLGEDRFTALLSCMTEAMESAWAYVPVHELVELFEGLPDVLAQRLRAWALGHAPNVDPTLLIDESEHAISSRRPTGDDLAVIDRAVRECEPSRYVDRWRDALGPAPTVEQAGEARRTDTVPSEWQRALRWVSLLPEDVTGAWAVPCGIIAAPYGPPGRESLERRSGVESVSAESPISTEQLQAMDLDSAAIMISQWRPAPDDWYVTADMLARTLESVVRDDPERWLASPVRIAIRLHHPTYINHYLRAAAAVASDHDLAVEQLLEVIKLVRTTPWPAEPLSRHRGDHDSDWDGALLAGIDLIKAMVETGYTFDAATADVWAILQSEVLICADAPEPAPRSEEDPLQSAINRRCTRALEAVLALVHSEFSATQTVRPEAVSLLDSSLHLPGRNGAEHRAILASRIGLLRYVLPDWTDDNRELLFGDQAPDGLGQTTIDLAIKWSSRPNAWLLENFRDEIRSAVERNVNNALKHLLIAMIWEIPGYSAHDNVAFLRRSPDLASRSGEALGRLLHNGEPEQRFLEITSAFWRTMLQQTTGNALLGFGWLSMVEELDSEVWADLTLKTLEATRGRIDWSHRVAERVAASPPTPTGLAIMNKLVRGQHDPWGSRGIIDQAVRIVDAARDLSATEEFQRLHNALLERGAIET